MPRTEEAAQAFHVELYNAFVKHVTSNQRRGQAWMNALREVMPEFYESICNTDADCFYDDRKVPAFHEIVFGGKDG